LEERTNTILSLQKELDDLKETRQRDKERDSRRMQDDSDELQILRHRIEELEQNKQDLQMQVRFIGMSPSRCSPITSID